MKPSVRLIDLTNMLFILAGLLDKGQNISIGDLWNRIEQSTLLEFIGDMAQKHGIMGKYSDHGDFPGYYYNALQRVSEDRPIEIRENGIAMLLAYTTEIIQAGDYTWTPFEYARIWNLPS